MTDIKPVAWTVLAERIEWLKAYSANGEYPKIPGPNAGSAYELALELERLQSEHAEALAARDAEIAALHDDIAALESLAAEHKQRAEEAEERVDYFKKDVQRFFILEHWYEKVDYLKGEAFCRMLLPGATDDDYHLSLRDLIDAYAECKAGGGDG
jgi:hypothetical protein